VKKAIELATTKLKAMGLLKEDETLSVAQKNFVESQVKYEFPAYRNEVMFLLQNKDKYFTKDALGDALFAYYNERTEGGQEKVNVGLILEKVVDWYVVPRLASQLAAQATKPAMKRYVNADGKPVNDVIYYFTPTPPTLVKSADFKP
jgi:hypothetical protein